MERTLLMSISIEELQAIIIDSVNTCITLNARLLQVSRNVNPYEQITRKELREEKKVSYAKIHQLMKSGDLAYHKEGRSTKFKREDVETCFSGKKKRG